MSTCMSAESKTFLSFLVTFLISVLYSFLWLSFSDAFVSTVSGFSISETWLLLSSVTLSALSCVLSEASVISVLSALSLSVISSDISLSAASCSFFSSSVGRHWYSADLTNSRCAASILLVFASISCAFANLALLGIAGSLTTLLNELSSSPSFCSFTRSTSSLVLHSLSFSL